ncbi:CocE/NonD family hydrolase [Streptomyces graminilatus]|uniref:CocE/NonD family hydrolase n=1 Tax=Streptomyces graminilatus TaxID=1464070 RepID=UPI0006E26AA4|nr:CocE/NonD family hydrolase [Streptomyces graminilatus]
MEITHFEPGPVPAQARPVAVPMRDGVQLAADVYLPSDTGPAPAVLVRLPYDKNGEYCFMREIAAYIVGRGYATVVQDVRGKFRSEGDTVFGVHEVNDGYDTVDWVSKQEWCDGSVVMWGDSYFGLTQLAAVASGHPALRAISPRLTGTQLASTVPAADGHLAVDPNWRREYFATHYITRDTYLWDADWSQRPLVDQFEQFFAEIGERSPSYDRDMTEPSALRGLDIEDLAGARPVPTLFTVGWYDNCAMWSWQDITRLSQDPEWARHLHLRLEAIDHENFSLADAPITAETNHAESPEPRSRLIAKILDPALAFFDHWLGRAEAEQPTRVTYEVCQEGWRTAEQWPPAGGRELVLHAAAGDDERHGRLSAEIPYDTGEFLRWTSDGSDLVPSIAKDPFAMVYGKRDLAVDTERGDVASVESAPLDDDLVLAGPVSLHGVLRADQPSTDLHVRLLDIDQEGRGTLIARGNVRLFGTESYTPFQVGLLHAAYRVAPGHRLRLHLADSDHPDFFFNPGDGSDSWTALKAASCTSTLALGGSEGLRLSLTVLPNQADWAG